MSAQPHSPEPIRFANPTRYTQCIENSRRIRWDSFRELLARLITPEQAERINRALAPLLS